ncbi:signal peptidase II [Candidatus Gracilibacteria bacterium]|nr:signal peptidase II [Candidatus Gracilibacteria bacterium]
MKKTIIKTSILTIILLAIDIISKYFFYNKEYLSNLKIINPIMNYGISRGIQANITMVIIISFLSLFLFLYLFKIKYIGEICLSLLLAGTLGNMIDRIFLGGVRDFISISTFPIFNISDILLNIGILLILINEFFLLKKSKKSLHYK